MKLPAEVGKHFELSDNGWDLDFAEAIVRDCAKIAGDMAKLENDGYDRNGHERAILARYGLEPKT